MASWSHCRKIFPPTTTLNNCQHRGELWTALLIYVHLWVLFFCPQVPVVNYSKGIHRSFVLVSRKIRNSAVLASDLLTAIRPSLQIATKHHQIPWCKMIILSRVLLLFAKFFTYFKWINLSGLGSNTFYQIQIQIQIQKFGFFKYKYKYKYFIQLCFKYKYKYKCIDSNTNTNTNTFNQIYLPKLFGSKIGKFFKSPKICSWSVFPNV